MKRLSVLMPAWNAATTISGSIESALADDDRIEVIVVDDASDDETPGVVASLQARYPDRIRYERLERNCGPSAARNRALEIASGDWVALLDSDDLWMRGRVARLEPLLADADVVSDALEVHTGTHRSLIPPFPRASTTLLDRELLVKRDLGYLQPLLKKEFLSHRKLCWDSAFRHSEDFLLAWEILGARARWLHLQEPGYIYVRSPNSLTSQRRRGLLQGLEVVQSLLQSGALAPGLRSTLHGLARVKLDLLALENFREHPGLFSAIACAGPLLRLAARWFRHRFLR